MSKKVPEPKKQFVIGNVEEGADFTKDWIESLIYQIALFYKSPESDRNYDDPVLMARQKIQECLLGTTETGDPWKAVPRAFEDRVRAKCGFDIASMKGIPSRRVKNPAAERAIDKAAIEAAKELDDLDITQFNAEQFRQNMERDLLLTFPELDNPAHLPNVRSLTMYYAEREKIDEKLAHGVNDSKRLQLLDSLRKIEEMADTTMKRMGIHPDQIRRKIADKGASSVSDLAAVVEGEALKDEFKKREKVWTLQLALQLWWMSKHRNGAGTGPQVHDFEIWHMTRSRPVKFKCRHGETYNLIEGFEPHELREFLLKEGVLIEEPVISGLFTGDALKGLSTAELTVSPKDGNYGNDRDAPNEGGAGVD
jgi:hypothetical protein